MITKMIMDRLVKNHKTFYCKEIKQYTPECDIYIYNYLLSDKEAFMDENNLGSELRGLCVIKENAKENIFLSIPKFFNINEIESTQIHTLKNKKIKKISEKVDGVLIQPVKICGNVQMKTKQNFENKEATIAQELLESDEELKFFILDCWDNNFQPLFELVQQNDKIVIDYPENKLILIAVRSENGEFIDIDKFDYPNKAKTFNLSLDEMIQNAKNLKGIEGYVVKFTDGTIVKIKTSDYLQKHKIVMETDSMKNILRRILQEDMDDVYSIISENKLQKIRKIEKAVTDYVISFIAEIEDITKKGDGGNRRGFVKQYINHKYFPVIMAVLHGKNVKDALINYLLRKYTKEKAASKFIAEITNF